MQETRTAAGQHLVVIGAGPAGLAAAHAALQQGAQVTIIDQGSVGGMAATATFEGRDGTYRFDYGGHRFITHNRDLLTLVDDLLDDDLLVAERQSVIRLGGRIYKYPLEAGDLLRHAPKVMLARAAKDLARSSLKRQAPPEQDDFESWTRHRFGPTLYETFFKGYTQKLWGLPPSDLSGDWADQRISLMNLGDVARRLLPGAGNGLRTYARSYRYPKLGFGMLFDRLAARVQSLGASLKTQTSVTGLHAQGGRVTAVMTNAGDIECDGVVSTVPLPTMVQLTGGQCSLKFRGLRFFNMPMAGGDVSPWTWQYLSDPHTLATRLQEPRRRSPWMAPQGMSSLMLEIPCDPGDPLWEMSDEELYPKVLGDLAALGIDPARSTGEYFSARLKTAYPLMTVDYQTERQAAFDHLAKYENLVQCGRQGAFRYVFTDTAMEMGMLAAQSLLSGEDQRGVIADHRNERIVIETESIA